MRLAFVLPFHSTAFFVDTLLSWILLVEGEKMGFELPRIGFCDYACGKSSDFGVLCEVIKGKSRLMNDAHPMVTSNSSFLTITMTTTAKSFEEKCFQKHHKNIKIQGDAICINIRNSKSQIGFFFIQLLVHCKKANL
jgi:hypothetical protein